MSDEPEVQVQSTILELKKKGTHDSASDPVEEGHSKLLCWLGNGGPAAPALRKQRRVDLCKFKTSQPGQPRRPCLKNSH